MTNYSVNDAEKILDSLRGDPNCAHCFGLEGRWLIARVRELEGLIRLGMEIDEYAAGDVLAWQRMAQVALTEPVER